MTHIIIDSTSDFTEDTLQYKDTFDILPVIVYIDEKEHLDGVDIHVEDVLQAHKDKKRVKTAQTSLYTIQKLFEEKAMHGHDFIFLSFTSKHSGLYETAAMIINQLKDDYPDVKMQAIDTMGATAPIGLLALELRQMDEEGVPFDQLVDYAYKYTQEYQYYFVVKELDHLARGGRISTAASIAGNVLDIKPLLQLKDGSMAILKKIRNYKRALKELVKISLTGIDQHKDQPILVGYGADRDIALQLKESLEQAGCSDVRLFQVGSGLATHLGISGVGILFRDYNDQ